MKSLFDKLDKLSTKLDKMGHYKLASDINIIIAKYSKDNLDIQSKLKNLGKRDVEIDPEEYNYLKSVFQDLGESLNNPKDINKDFENIIDDYEESGEDIQDE